ncbi:hypothetical protein F5884DRAFT_459135 [Xylogone sp. PMI_703]|nr:hypothetical protein F5884DRAFT_459135 [Xylogone sp. PMI_703]
MSFFGSAKSTFDSFAADARRALGDIKDIFESEIHCHTTVGEFCHKHHEHTADNRYLSFAAPRAGNHAKWYVDGCGYFWAVSEAIERAEESIWILDWWLSPELYLRRPPSENEKYRLDRMLVEAAERGVKVNIIVYKEVEAVLTLDSAHTKHALEVHPNIAVFRHPDHAPSGQVIESEIKSTFKDFSFKTLDLCKLPSETLSKLYGVNDDVVLYWAHHEKLCLIDGKLAFMGGLDMCFGRWDVNQHPIADAHPANLDDIVFPGQDFNNARIYDFANVSNWEQNKLDRTKNSRMGWSDISISLQGPVVEDLRAHFVQRWNFIYYEKYDVRKDDRYTALSMMSADGEEDPYYKQDGSRARAFAPVPDDPDAVVQRHHYLPGGVGSIYDRVQTGLNKGLERFAGGGGHHSHNHPAGVSIQLVRSCSRWSHGVATEHSIANAYIGVIEKSQHFIYIENQFFITATDDAQHPVMNKIGAAIVDRIIRAYQEGQNYKVIVCIPSVPGFAGDLHGDDALGTRAIMEFQYFSICRGGNSIIEKLQKAGVPDASKYIRFYNLRNYDRINAGQAMDEVQESSGISYEDARKEHDDMVGAGYYGRGERTGATSEQHHREYDRYQQATQRVSGEPGSSYDTVSACYEDNGISIRDIPWAGSKEAEMDAFVSEELYIHSKILIADDRVVICGSANLNDRSQLGTHDSEIAVVIEDPTPVESSMDGEPYQASRFAASLRRQIFRKHLGLLPAQDWTRPNANFTPVSMDPNVYDWGSPADLLVEDVLSHNFSNLWNGTARTNTEVFAKAFHVVPADNVRNWDDYQNFYGQYFLSPSPKDEKDKKPSRYPYGHVVKEEFPGGVDELKDWLDRVRGNLVEMPLSFMDGVDFAKEGLELNALTEVIYT